MFSFLSDNVLEVTLRTDVAIEVIRRIATELPDAMIGAGTVTNEEQLKQVEEAGAKFAISPGLTTNLLEAGKRSTVALIPGVSSISELMKGLDLGYTHLKFFPAEAAGGAPVMKAMAGPFPNIKFCPTGGIGLGNALDYLTLPNVMCVGGSWIAKPKDIREKRWAEIEQLAREAAAIV